MLHDLRRSPHLRILLIFFTVLIITSALSITLHVVESEKVLEVHFMDVGQAESILIKTPGDRNILIDGGDNRDGPFILSYLKDERVKEFAAIVATHPHEDHIGGLDVVINTYPVKIVYMPAVSTPTKTFEDFIKAVQASGARRIEARVGVKLDISDPAISATFLAPCGEDYDSLNNYSAVLRLIYNKTSFLLAGDAETNSENEMLLSGQDLKATLLKVAHHGSDTSTTPQFLQAVSPRYAIISVGKGNTYGHPSKEVLERLLAVGASVYRTDEVGTIVAISDGRDITIEVRTSYSTPRAPPPKEIIVFITEDGKKYHMEGCRYLSKNKIPINLSAAKERGYTPCKVCTPPE